MTHFSSLEASGEEDVALETPPSPLELEELIGPGPESAPIAIEEERATAADEASGLRTDSLAASVVLLIVLSVVQRLVGFIRQVLVCRWLDTNQVGEWDICFKFLMLGAPLAVFGVPGSFGRYLEYYRHRGHLKTFLRRTTAVCIVLACVSTLTMATVRGWMSELIFATPDKTDTVLLLAGSLLALVAYNFFTDVLTALRMVRVTSVLQFASGILFAVLSVVLVLGWRRDSAAIVVAYAGSCALTLAAALVWFRGQWRLMPDPIEPLPHRQLWSKLAPFAIWLWSVNLLYNLVGVVDRYMMMHFASTEDPLTLVGQYHSSQIVPLLMVSMCSLIGGIIMPHLSHDWESGRSKLVGMKLNLTIKLLGLALFAGSLLTLFGGPLLFNVAFRGKYDGGLEILPWTLTYCIWMALIPLAQMYLWCVERPTLASLALAGSLVVNVVLCFLLLPAFGLHGVVWATAAANLFALACIYQFNRWHGLQVNRGVWLITLAPVALGAGQWVSALVFAVVVIGILTTNHILTPDEKELIAGAWRKRFAARRQTA